MTDTVVGVRMTKELKEALTREAEKNGLSLSASDANVWISCNRYSSPSTILNPPDCENVTGTEMPPEKIGSAMV